MNILSVSLLICFLSSFTLFGQSSIWEKEIMALEANDSINTPELGGIVFIGSSSIRGWRSLSSDFADKNVLNRGFGGSELVDAVNYFDRLVAKYEPKQVVLYIGENDIASGKCPGVVFNKFKEFAKRMRVQLPESELLFLSLKPSIARWDKYPEMEEVNAMVKKYASTRKGVKFIDISTAMLGENGLPKPEFYINDGLHMTEEGYKLWKTKVTPYLVE